ncbi:MAG: four-carbon acid sugar kinase family protein [Vicinamibacterales bacterium]
MLGLVADDLTGAGDASVQFAKRGWYTLLTLPRKRSRSPKSRSPSFRSPQSTSRESVLAVTTDCRALSNDSAETLTADALTALMNAGIDRVFLKIDSTMRGSVPGQVAGALAAWRTRYPDARAVVCPAYPAMGRTVESNRLLVRGEPVDRTVFGRDPVTPVTTSEMAALLPLSPHISMVDAATDDDLIAIAASISAAGPSIVAVGSGGLADALAATWCEGPSTRALAANDIIPKRKNSRILVQVSSMNPIAHAQVARLKRAFPDVVVLSAPAARRDSAAVVESLAREFAELIEREDWDVLGLIGGDGARETLARLGASGIRIVDSLLEGIPIGLVVGGHADGTAVFTKAGGFGGDDALVRSVERMRA